MSRVTQRTRITTVAAGERRERVDTLAVEEPLEIRVGGRSYTTTMRTPGHDVELAHGLLAAEGIIRGAEDVVSARYCAGSVMDDETGTPVNTYNVLDVELAPGLSVPENRVRRAVTSSACGVCGTESIQLLLQQTRVNIAADGAQVTPETLLAMPDALREVQKTFRSTGGLHGVALFAAEGDLLVAREDVGRHNATDKVLGWAMAHGRRPGAGTVLFVSGRTSFELAQKAAMAGVPVLAGISAPSSLAVDVCRAAGITLCGFVRGDSFNVYAHPERIA